jgi:hypothetical protein
MPDPTWEPNCEFYFADYFRGLDRQECRLLARGGRAKDWTIELCHSCPSPRIRQANRCPDMILEARVAVGFLGWGRKVVVEAFCTRTMRDVTAPMVGCGECHQYEGGTRGPQANISSRESQ